MTRVILTGGIGNQLFKSMGAINASGAGLQSICFDVTWYQATTFSNGLTAPRKFELSHFPALSNVPLKVRSSRLSKFESRLIESRPEFMELFGYNLGQKTKKIKLLPTRVFKSDFENIKDLPDEKSILKFLKFPSSTSRWSQSLQKIANSEKVIAVHIRRDDYLHFSNVYPKLGLSYYESALRYVTSREGNLPIWLFSDDPTGAVREFGKSIKFERVLIPPPEVPTIEILQLLSLMHAVITANSTFSWWGAYLGMLNGNVKRVTIPERFTNLEHDPGINLRTPGWEVIPN